MQFMLLSPIHYIALPEADRFSTISIHLSQEMQIEQDFVQGPMQPSRWLATML